MAEKEKKTTIAILTICIMLVSVGLSGCVEEDGEDEEEIEEYIEYAKEEDLRLVLSVDNQILQNYINITFKLINIDEHPISIENYFKPDHSILHLNLSGPNDEFLEVPFGISDRYTNITILEPYEFFKYTLPLRKMIIYYDVKNENGTMNQIEWNWTMKGIYKAWAVYYLSIDEHVYSNIAEFEIK